MSLEITELLGKCASGDRSSHESLVGLIYHELRAIASKSKQGFPKAEYDTSDLTHETFIRILNREGILQFENRRHLFGAYLVAVQRVLTDQARRQSSLKRGSGMGRVSLEKNLVASIEDNQFIETAELLDQLETENAIAASIARARLFRYTKAEIAVLLKLSDTEVNSHWRVARAWIRDKLEFERNP